MAKGYFKPKNPQKYKGDPTSIIYRSSYECRLMLSLDVHPDVLEWSSEEFSIPYVSPVDGRVHRYFPDFWVKRKDKEGNIGVVVIEVKPKYQTQPPVVKKKATKSYVNEVKNWGINSAKWEAAMSYCHDRNWEFTIFNEDHLGISK